MKYIYLVISFFIAHFSFADAWGELSKTEAEAVVAELTKNPYIFDYCDCCDNSGDYATSILFLKVTKAEIVACEMDENCFYVDVETIVLAEVYYGENGPVIDQLSAYNIEKNKQRIYMNYSWVFNPVTKLATPFFNVVPYNYYDIEKTACKTEFAYPTPKQLKAVSADTDYKKWYDKAM